MAVGSGRAVMVPGDIHFREGSASETRKVPRNHLRLAWMYTVTSMPVYPVANSFVVCEDAACTACEVRQGAIETSTVSRLERV